MDKFFACFSLHVLKVSRAACIAIEYNEGGINRSVHLVGILGVWFILKIYIYFIVLSLYLETFLLKTLIKVAKHHHKIALTSFKT